MTASLLKDLRTLLGEDQEHDALVHKADALTDLLELVRKKLQAFQTDFKRHHASPFAGHMSELSGEVARILRTAIVDIEKSSSLLEPDF